MSRSSRRVRPLMPVALGLATVAAAAALPAKAQNQPAPTLDSGFRLIYELKFPQARAQFASWEKTHPNDPVGAAAEAASYLYEEFYQQGVFTSKFFLDDKRLLGGVDRPPDPTRRHGFLEADRRAVSLAQQRLRTNPRDPDALFALTIATGMQADYASLIEKHPFESLKLTRQAKADATRLLAVKPDADDAYLALGAADYIIGCLPSYKRVFLWFGGIRGDRQRGIEELKLAADHGNYLRPFAKVLLALAALREKQPALADRLLRELVAEFPENPVFASELARLEKPSAGDKPR